VIFGKKLEGSSVKVKMLELILLKMNVYKIWIAVIKLEL